MNAVVAIVRGDPTPEELAALVVALRGARTANAPSPVTRPRPRRLLRGTLLPGPRGWRESSRILGGQP